MEYDKELLIDVVHSKPALWDKRSFQYQNRNIKNKELQDVNKILDYGEGNMSINVKMSKSGPNEEVVLNDEDSCLQDESNMKGDWLNILLLILMYTIQFVPYGFIYCLPILFQSKKLVTYEEQALFSMVEWPYILKVVWSPLVDSIFVRKIGRRKSWIIPIQYIIGFLLFYMAIKIDELVPESEKPNIKALVILFGVLFILANMQDIAVDGWSITMLKRKNVGYASICNAIGNSLGNLISMVCLILLTSEDFSNKYLRTVNGTGGLVTIKGFLYFWSATIVLITTLICILKKEKAIEFNNRRKINIIQSYKILWEIFNKSSVRELAIIMFTMMIGFAATKKLFILRLIDAGIPKDDITLMHISTIIIYFIVSTVFLKYYSTGLKPLSALLNIVPLRLFWSLLFTLLIYYTPTMISKNGIINVPGYYYIISGLIIGVNAIFEYSMQLFMTTFFSRISDPRFGGTYITFLNMVFFMSQILLSSLALEMVNVLTFSKCSNGFQNNCSTSVLETNCQTEKMDCIVIVNGHYIEIAICTIIGIVWYYICKARMENLQKMDLSHWNVNWSA